MDIRNAACHDSSGNPYSFNDIAGAFETKDQMARYFTYKDWRDRGLIPREVSEIKQKYDRNPMKKYPASTFSMPK